MDRLDELTFFLAIVDRGSLNGAARQLHRSAAAATRALASLEARVGSRLIERTTRRMSPTAAGLAFAETARGLVAGYEAAVAGASEGAVRGLVRVTAPVLFGRRHVAPVVSGFLDAYPETQVELVLADRNLDLVEEGIDVAVRIGHLAESRLVARRVGQVRSDRGGESRPTSKPAARRASRPSLRPTTPSSERSGPAPANGASAPGGRACGSCPGSSSTRSMRR